MKHLIIKALTNSEWDTCTFAIVPIDKEIIEYWKTLFDAVTGLAKPIITTGGHIAVYDESAYYFADDSDLPDSIYSQLNDKYWLIMDEEECFFTSYKAPETKLEAEMLKMTFHGVIYFSAFGEYTGEEFYTEDISLETILNHELILAL